jgi:hypothetical protein
MTWIRGSPIGRHLGRVQVSAPRPDRRRADERNCQLNHFVLCIAPDPTPDEVAHTGRIGAADAFRRGVRSYSGLSFRLSLMAAFISARKRAR